MVAAYSALIVDDDPAVRGLIRAEFEAESVAVVEVDSCATARQYLSNEPTSIVFLDVQLPDGSGMDLIAEFTAAWPDTPVVMITGYGSVESAVQAMQVGAFTYLEKPFNEGELTAVLRNALKTGRLLTQASDRRKRDAEDFGFGTLLAESPAMQQVIERARAAADSPASTILLLGESGTGKGLLSRAIHAASGRAAEPFLTVTCSAIPEHLLESNLFGHEKGAFTDAKETRKGVFEAAHNGTVLLDEVGDMPLSLQSKLLGVLEDRAYTRVGSHEERSFDVRIIAATHRNLEEQTANGDFREDLLYRLNVVPIVIPSLRERKEDIEPLALSFVQRYNAEFGRTVTGFSPAAQSKLTEYGWPGNVRELRNVVERAMLFVDKQVIDADDLTLVSGYHPGAKKAPATPAPTAERAEGIVLPEQGINLDQLEQELIRQAMERTGGVKAHAATLLGLTRDQIRTRLKKI
ncbi:MAG: sigma-54-dependent transcriptional regulator [Planctomycetota bacterium]|jgi:DNA-binding NtrC family response regulator